MAFGWLKNFGELAKAGAAIIPILGPIAATFIPGKKDDQLIAKITDSLDEVTKIVMHMEMAGAALGLKGEDKLKGAIPAVAQILLQSTIMAGQAPGNQALFMEGVADITNGMVKILNAKAVTP